MAAAPASAVSLASLPSVGATAASPGKDVVFSAFQVHTLAEGITSKTEVAFGFGSHIFLGTSDGVVLQYRVAQLGSTWSASLENKRQISGKRIEKMEVVPREKQLIVLSDGNLFVLSVVSLDVVSTLASAKGASCFCVLTKGPESKLAVAIKKKISIFLYYSNDWIFDKELIIPDTPLSMAWIRQTFCLAFRREYSLLSEKTGDVRTLFALQPDAQPLVRALDTEEFIVTMDCVAQTVDSEGEANRPAMKLANPPVVIGFSFPYIATAGGVARTLEIRSMDNENLAQSVPVAEKDRLIALCELGSRMVMVTAARITMLVPVPLAEQVDTLLQQRRVNEALRLHEIASPLPSDSPERAKEVAAIHETAGLVLFNDTNFSGAVQHLVQSDVDARAVLVLFPDLLPTGVPIGITPRHSILSGRTIEEIVRTSLAGKKGFGSAEKEKLALKLVEKARRELVSFLLDRRRTLNADAPALPFIDTALLKLYVDTGARDDLYQLLRRKNALVLADAVPVLRAPGAFHFALALLYSSRDMFEEALAELSGLLSHEFSDPDPAPERYLATFVEVLSRVPDSPLLWQHAALALDTDPHQAIEIFTSGVRDPPLSIDRVLDYLATRPARNQLVEMYLEHVVRTEQNTTEKYHTMLALQYLDTVLLLLPTEHRTSMRRAPGSEQGVLGKTRAKLDALLESSRYYSVEALLQRVEPTELYEECVMLYARAGMHEQALRTLIHKMADYDAAEAYCLRNCPPLRPLFDASPLPTPAPAVPIPPVGGGGGGGGASTGPGAAVATSAAGAATAAAAGAPPAASPYNALLLLLLRVLLRTEGRPVLLEAAMSLLQRHAAVIDPTTALRLLPETAPLDRVAAYLAAALRQRASAHRNAMAVASLARSDTLQGRYSLVEARGRYVSVLPESVCPVCKKRIGDTVIAVFPNSTTVHFKCMGKNPSVDPVTGTNFAVRPAL